MKIRFLTAVFAGLLMCSPAGGRDLSSMYSDNELRACRYAENLQRIYVESVWQHFGPAEQARLRSVELSFPLRSPRGCPVDFYATAQPARVTLPIMSLKFLDDLCIAHAWLVERECDPGVLDQYLYMLMGSSEDKFGGVYQSPQEALGLPDDVLDDPRVDGMSQKLLKSAGLFLLLHELGHTYYQHPGYGSGVTPAQARANERQADAFALEIMRRIGLYPAGAAVMFKALAIITPDLAVYDTYGDWASEATHPVSADRIRLVGRYMQDHAGDFARSEPNPVAAAESIRDTGARLSQLAALVGDPEVIRLGILQAEASEVSMLQPDCRGQNQNELFNGLYATTLSDVLGLESSSSQLLLSRVGNEVSGVFTINFNAGTLTGTVVGRELYFEWYLGAEFGLGVFRMNDDGSAFQGSWGRVLSKDDGGGWAGYRLNE